MKISFLTYWITFVLYMTGAFLLLIIVDTGLYDDWLEESSSVLAPALPQIVKPKNQTQTLQNDLNEELLAKLRKGGYTLYIRHTNRNSGPSTVLFDRMGMVNPSYKTTVTETGHCLNKIGIEEAKALALAYKTLGIPIGTVYATPICRATETAQYMFGRVDILTPGFVFNNILASDEEMESRTALAEEILATIPAPGKNNVIVGHTSTQTEVGFYSGSLAEGGAIIIKHNDADSYEAIAVLTPEKLVKALDIPLENIPYTPTN